MMPRGDQLLMPLNPWFMWGSLVVALLLNMLPMGRFAGLPDFLAVTLVFWNVYQPRRVGVGAAFLLGMLMDVHQGALLGQHALSYTCLSYFAITIHRRLLWFTISAQTIQVLPLFVAAHFVSLLVRLSTGSNFPGPGLLFAPLLEALMWPIVTKLLLTPQRRAPDRDKNRPL